MSYEYLWDVRLNQIFVWNNAMATCVCQASVVHVSEDISKVAPWVGPWNMSSKVWFQTSQQPETRCLVSFIMPFTVYYTALPCVPQIKSVTILAQARCFHDSTARAGGKDKPSGKWGKWKCPSKYQREQRRAIDRKSNEIAELKLADEAVKTEEMEQDLYEKGWTRHPVQGSSDEYWWCRVEYFFETEPRGWSKFLDANTGKEYWWHDSGRWFWVESWWMGPCWELTSALTDFRWGLRALTKPRRAPGDSMQSEEMARFISPPKNGLFLSRQIQHRQTPTDCAILNGFYSPKSTAKKSLKRLLGCMQLARFEMRSEKLWGRKSCSQQTR